MTRILRRAFGFYIRQRVSHAERGFEDKLLEFETSKACQSRFRSRQGRREGRPLGGDPYLISLQPSSLDRLNALRLRLVCLPISRDVSS